MRQLLDVVSKLESIVLSDHLLYNLLSYFRCIVYCDWGQVNILQDSLNYISTNRA